MTSDKKLDHELTEGLEPFVIHACISGFRQTPGDYNGTVELREKLIRSGHSMGVESRVEYYTWNTNWNDIAEHYSDLRRIYQTWPTICLYAYSWGAGWGAVRLARELYKRGLSVHSMALCDPIYRHPSKFLSWVSMLVESRWFPRPAIRIPANVQYVFGVHQTISTPMGFLVQPENELKTQVLPSIHLEVAHVHIHKHQDWHSLCIEAANRVFKGEPPWE